MTPAGGGDVRERVAYHLSELAIARDPAHPGHSNPPIQPGARVLDVGCGAGQTLIAAAGANPSTGVDLDLAALRLGKRLAPGTGFACATGEALPFPPAHFDLVICRVALPFMHVPTALAEMRRVLRPGGGLWITAHPASFPLRALRRASVPGKLYQLYVLLNGLLFHLTLRQIRFPGHGCESFQTCAGMRRALRALGLEEIAVTPGTPFLVTARAPAGTRS